MEDYTLIKQSALKRNLDFKSITLSIIGLTLSTTNRLFSKYKWLKLNQRVQEATHMHRAGTN